MLPSLGATRAQPPQQEATRAFNRAFALLQIIEPIMHGLHWPDEVLTWLVVALAIGFPIVVGLAWIFDVNQGRIERTEHNQVTSSRALVLADISFGLCFRSNTANDWSATA